MKTRLGIATGLLLLCAWSVVRLSRPPRPVPATAPDTVFSAERAMHHVEEIAVRPHAIGMPDHDRVRDYIVAQLTALGLRPQIQTTTGISTRYQAAGRVQNILSWMPGTDSKGKAVLVAVHYDGVAAGPSAGDDAAGVAAILETVRALRAQKATLGHDVILLFTDGEEAGLLGAAAFVREHPWAKDVAIAINFEARGTAGRSLMFETGPGDLAVVRALRGVGGVTAGSVFTTVYRSIANDTDLSELAVLGMPALNFAFAEGVERYHTSQDSFAHLDAGSVQHHGSQMLALVRELASGPLPLPQTGDAVFFDLPVIGLVVYPVGVALPLAIVALLLTGVVAFRVKRGIVVGAAVSLVAVVVSAVIARVAGDGLRVMQASLPWGGAAEWSGIYGSAVALLAVAVTLLAIGVGKRWTADRGLIAGVLVVWAILSVAVTVMAPGASYLFTWPALLWATAELIPERWRAIGRWVAAAFTLLLLVGFAYGVSVVMLGVFATGALALGVLVSLVTLLVSPLVSRVTEGARLGGAPWAFAAALAFAAVGIFAVRRSPSHPTRSALAYIQNADSTDAWFGTLARVRDPWTQAGIGATTPTPEWTSRLIRGRFVGRKVDRVALPAPSVVLVRDTLIDNARRVVLRVHAPPGAMGVWMRASGAAVIRTAIDGRVVDTTRYRYPSRDWVMEYAAVPDSGAFVSLSVPEGARFAFEVTSQSPGLPVIPGVEVRPRPTGIVPSQAGDASYVYRRVTF